MSPVSRRDLITGGAVLGAGGLTVAFALSRNSGNGHGDDRVSFVAEGTADATDAVEQTPEPTTESANATAEATQAGTPIDPATILESASITDLRDGMESGAFTAEHLMQAVLDRIEQFDRQGPNLGAVIELIPDALDQARAADAARASGEPPGLLHGIPVLVKDIIATNDGMKTAAGSTALEDNVVVRDAFLVTQLRNAGAIIIGKANLTEWSNFKGNGSASGYSPRGGQTRNPYDPKLSPWGSSSGSAVGVAAGYVPLAIGSETNGSITMPAAASGVVGFKPTAGLVSRNGVIPLSQTQDSPGPMTRSVRDAAIALSVMAGFDPDDVFNGELAAWAPAAAFAENPVPEPGTRDYTKDLRDDALEGAKIGVCRSLFYFDERIVALVEDTLDLMERAGAEIIDEIYVGSLDELEEKSYSYPIYLTELKTGVSTFLETYTPDGPITSLADVVAYNDAHEDEELIYGDQSALVESVELGQTLDSPEYLGLLETHTTLARTDGIDAAMDEFEVDVLIAPTASLPTPINNEGDVDATGSSSLPSFAGYPSITIPIGEIGGLPVGMHLFGRAFSESTLLSIAHAVEQIVPKRNPPKL